MSSQILAVESSIQSYVTHKAKQLVHLAESLGYPHSLSAEHIPAIRTSLQNEYRITSQQQHAPASALSTSIFRSSVAHRPTLSQGDNGAVESSPAAAFLEWLLDNLTAETNWPGYEAHPTSLHNIMEVDFDRGQDDDQFMQTLDREHAQLQNTLASLEQELADLQSLESETIDSARTLDMDVHDTSVEHDSTIEKLGELAHHVYSKYDPSLHSNGTAGSPEFLYLCQRELEHIQLLDQQLVDLTRSIHDFIVTSVELDSSTLSTSQHQKQHQQHKQTPQHLLFEQLLKQNSAHDKELVRLCSVYRATKMSHIRAMAQLQSLEEQVRYMAAIDAQLTLQQQQEEEQAAREGDTTGDHMYTIATAKNKVIQQTRQQEIELISVQREKARLMDELEQLLSEPDGQRVVVVECQDMDNEIDPTRRGVLVDICERISRTDIELQYLTVAHQDHVEKQETALKDLQRTVDQMVEYYGHSQIVEQALAQEQGQIRQHKDVLWALIQELESRSSAHEDPSQKKKKRLDQTLPTSTACRAPTISVDFQALFTTLQEHLELGTDIRKEKESLVEKVDQLMRSKSLLLHDVVHQHSTTNQVCFEPAEIHQAKERLIQRVQDTQQEYTALESRVQKTISKK
ncbi:hypothetical protein BG005_004757 [Podila minutissima]|nr:hypothetical protein BG005_004757 [Podila minutissima]